MLLLYHQIIYVSTLLQFRFHCLLLHILIVEQSMRLQEKAIRGMTWYNMTTEYYELI